MLSSIQGGGGLVALLVPLISISAVVGAAFALGRRWPRTKDR